MHLFSGRKNSANRELVEQIVLIRYNQYYRLAYSYAHNEADAYDIVQNGVYKALRGCQSLKEPEYAATWVYRIMLNECFDYVRHPNHLSYESLTEERGIELGQSEDTYADIDVQRALDALPPEDKAVVILKYYEDKTLEEIAELLEENVNTIKSRLYRCLKKLRLELTEDSEEKGDISSRRRGDGR